MFNETKVYHVDRISIPSCPEEEVGWLNIAMYVTSRVKASESSQKLVYQQKCSFQREDAAAGCKHIIKTWT